MKPPLVALWVALVALPVVLCCVAVFACFPETVPIHFGADGQVDRYGSRLEVIGIGAAFSGGNLLMAILSSKAHLLNRPSKYSIPIGVPATRAMLAGTGVFLVLVNVFVLWMIAGAL